MSDQQPESATKSEDAEFIGTATMEQNGDIVLLLRATADSGAMGEASFRYHPGTPEHAEILHHVKGLQPGESKLVAPWPDGD